MSNTERATQRLDDPDDLKASDYLRVIEGGGTALHVYLKDDKEWWLAHNPKTEYPGRLNGSWLWWSTYPSGPWTLTPNRRELMYAVVDELYYIDYHGEEQHSVHELTAKPLSHAPDFVQAEFPHFDVEVRR